MDLSDYTFDTLPSHGDFVLSRGRCRTGSNPQSLSLIPEKLYGREREVETLG